VQLRRGALAWIGVRGLLHRRHTLEDWEYFRSKADLDEFSGDSSCGPGRIGRAKRSAPRRRHDRRVRTENSAQWRLVEPVAEDRQDVSNLIRPVNFTLSRNRWDLDNGVIYVRRSVWRGHELTPKTENGVRPIDIDPVMVETLRTYLGGGGSMRTLLFQSSKGPPLSDVNIRNRVLGAAQEARDSEGRTARVPTRSGHRFAEERHAGRPVEAVDRALQPANHGPLLAHG
jgi:hypothetical protein